MSESRSGVRKGRREHHDPDRSNGTNELRDAIQVPALSPFVAVRDGRISAYATTLTFLPAAHAVADTDGDMRALILGAVAAEEQPASFLLPTRQAGLFRWCLDEGLRVIKP